VKITDYRRFDSEKNSQHFKQYLGLLSFKVIIDYPALKFLQTADVLTGKHAKWMMYLQQF